MVVKMAFLRLLCYLISVITICCRAVGTSLCKLRLHTVGENSSLLAGVKVRHGIAVARGDRFTVN
jgi:hypothetical protein